MTTATEPQTPEAPHAAPSIPLPAAPAAFDGAFFRRAIPSERVRACILTGYIGDVLGSQTEGRPYKAILANTGGRLVSSIGRSSRVYTDDTEMTLALADAIVNLEGFERNGVHLKHVEWFTASRGYSRPTREYFMTAQRSRSFQPRGVGSAANGAVMRIAPLGLVAVTDLATLRLAIQEALYYTHNHVESRDAALVHCVAVRCLALGGAHSGAAHLIKQLRLLPDLCEQVYDRLERVQQALVHLAGAPAASSSGGGGAPALPSDLLLARAAAGARQGQHDVTRYGLGPLLEEHFRFFQSGRFWQWTS